MTLFEWAVAAVALLVVAWLVASLVRQRADTSASR